MEKDFEARESKTFQQQILREAEHQRELDDRDELYSKKKGHLENLKKQMFLERCRFIALAKKITPDASPTNSIILAKILGFLRGETNREKDEVVKPLNLRIAELKAMNSDLCEEMRKLDLKNTMLENQIALLDNKVAEVSDKITSAENKQIIAYEEKRKAVLDYRALEMINKNLESIIESHEREKQRLMFELKRFTKGKLRSNVLEAELDRKDKQNQIVKRGCEVSKAVYTNLEASKSC